VAPTRAETGGSLQRRRRRPERRPCASAPLPHGRATAGASGGPRAAAVTKHPTGRRRGVGVAATRASRCARVLGGRALATRRPLIPGVDRRGDVTRREWRRAGGRLRHMRRKMPPYSGARRRRAGGRRVAAPPRGLPRQRWQRRARTPLRARRGGGTASAPSREHRRFASSGPDTNGWSDGQPRVWSAAGPTTAAWLPWLP